MQQQKRVSIRKLYFPGLISLALFPLLFIVYSYYINLSKIKYGIHVAWGDDPMIKAWAEYQKKPFNPGTFRKFKNDSLIGDDKKDAVLLNHFEQTVRMLSNTRDTVNGFSITFADHTKYEDIIRCIDICAQLKSKHIAFILYKNRILVWRGEPYSLSPPPPENVCCKA
jgi:hypothetical protein